MAKTKDAMPITVSFKRNLRSDGELIVVTLRQEGDSIHLTAAQVKALVIQLQTKIA